MSSFSRLTAIAIALGVTATALPCIAKDKEAPSPAPKSDGVQPKPESPDKPDGSENPPATGPSATDRETARNLMDHGQHKYDAGNYVEALKSFQAADELVGVTSTGLAVGRTLEKLGRLVEARDKLLKVSRIPAVPDEPPVLTLARNDALQLQDQIADRIPTVTFEIKGVEDPNQVSINVGSYTVPSSAVTLPQRVDPGQQDVTASCPGYGDVTVSVVMSEGEVRSVVLEFKVGVGTPPPPSEGISPLVWAGFGTAGAGLLLGTITGAVSLSMAADVEEQCLAHSGNENSCPSGVKGDADTSLALAHVSTISFILAGAGVAVGVTGLLLGGGDEADKPTTAFTIEPVIGLGSLGVRGTF